MVSVEADKYKFICFTDKGRELMLRLCEGLCKNLDAESSSSDYDSVSVPEEKSVGDLKIWTKDNFKKGNILVFIGAVGIAVRATAPFIKDKLDDPAVIVIDEKGSFVIPVLSGHIGGAVDAAKMLSEIIGATPIITTATDTRGEFAVDVFATKNGLKINDMKKAKEFTSSLLKNGIATYFVDNDFAGELIVSGMPENILLSETKDKAGFLISPRRDDGRLCLIPPCLVVGIGCKKGKSKDEIKAFLIRAFEKEKLDIRAVKAICSIDIKKDEEGITSLADELEIPFVTFSPDELMVQKGDFKGSDFVKETTGVDNVCERSVAAYGCKRLIMKKTAENGVTLAVGIIKTTMEN